MVTTIPTTTDAGATVNVAGNRATPIESQEYYKVYNQG